MRLTGTRSRPSVSDGRAAIEREANGLVCGTAKEPKLDIAPRAELASKRASIFLIASVPVGRRQVDACRRASGARRPAAPLSRLATTLRWSVWSRPHDQRRRLFQRDLGLEQPQGVDPDATKQQLGEIERELGVLGRDGFHQRQARGIGELEAALDRHVGEIVHAQRSGQLDLAAGPGGQARR